jgi:WD40 repeat protein
MLTMRGPEGNTQALVFSPDGRRITAAASTVIESCDAASGRQSLEIMSYKYIEELPRKAAFSPDGRRLAVAYYGGFVRVWDVAARQVVLTLKGAGENVDSLAYSPDGRRLAAAYFNAAQGRYLVRVWEAADGREAWSHRVWRGAVVFSPDGHSIADGKSVRDAADGHEVLTLAGGEVGVTALAYSPDGRRLAVAYLSGFVRVWDAADGREVFATRGGAAGELSDVVYTPDGRRIATGGRGGVRIWDAGTGHELLWLGPASRDARVLAFSPDGRRLAAGGLSVGVRVWDATPVDAETPAERRELAEARWDVRLREEELKIELGRVQRMLAYSQRTSATSLSDLPADVFQH